MLNIDNGGYNTSPHPGQSQPVISQTALILTNGTANDDTTVTVVAGARYRATCTKTGSLRFGLATMSTAGNVRWVCGIGQSIEIQIPNGYTSLHFATDTNDGYGWLVRIKTEIEEEPTL